MYKYNLSPEVRDEESVSLVEQMKKLEAHSAETLDDFLYTACETACVLIELYGAKQGAEPLEDADGEPEINTRMRRLLACMSEDAYDAWLVMCAEVADRCLEEAEGNANG